MQSNTSKRLSLIIGILMIVAMGSSAILPLLSQVAQTDPNALPEPTTTPVPTFAPPPEASTITVDQTYLHPSGLYTVGYPSGWVPGTGTNNGVQAQINFTNSDVRSVIEAYVDVPETPLTTLDELSARYNDQIMQRGWRNYDSANETARRQQDDKLLIDFELTQGGQTYLARHEAWIDGDWIKVVRVVTPSNARDLLLHLLDVVAPTLNTFQDFQDTPVFWTSYFDPQALHLIRYPASWTLTDGGPGLPTSIIGDDHILRVETVDSLVTDETAAREWVEGSRPGISILSVTPIERDGNAGFSVAYGYRDVDGNSSSGLALLLNSAEENRTHVANLRFPGEGIDLNNLPEEAPQEQTNLATMMETFTIMPQLANVTTGS